MGPFFRSVIFRTKPQLAKQKRWIFPGVDRITFAVCTNTTNVWSGEKQSTKRER
eukprot:COSAG06_NODE_53037_length_302_cov_0.970443_1_plen_53_part_10